MHASSHTPGSWCPTLLRVSDGTGLTTLLRVWEKRHVQFQTAQLPFRNDANFVNHPGAADIKMREWEFPPSRFFVIALEERYGLLVVCAWQRPPAVTWPARTQHIHDCPTPHTKPTAARMDAAARHHE